MNAQEIKQKYLGDKSFIALSQEQQKRILQKNPNAEQKAMKRASKYVGKSDKYFKAAEDALPLISALSMASTKLMLHLKKNGFNGTVAKMGDVDKAISSLRSTFSKERSLLERQGSGNSRLDEIQERQLNRDF